MTIFKVNSKTDKYRDCPWVLIDKTKLCPDENVKKLIQSGKLSHEDYLFCNICLTKTVFQEQLKPHVDDDIVFVR